MHFMQFQHGGIAGGAPHFIHGISRQCPRRPTELSSEVREGEKYSLSPTVFRFDCRKHLRAIAKIALSFARLHDIHISAESPALRFLRDDSVSFLPITAPETDIVTFADYPPHPLNHGLFLHKSASTTHLFAYVVLFELLEFIVLLDEQSTVPPTSIGYLYNLVTAREENRSFTWSADAEAILPRLGTTRPKPDRFQERVAGFGYWYSHRQEVWANRALAAAQASYYELLDKGVDGQIAQIAAIAEANRLLLPYGLSIKDVVFKNSD